VTDDAGSIRRRSQYGTCGECGQLKHVTADGLLYGHNAYVVDGTSVATVRCAGSGTSCAGVDTATDGLPA
jgi:hypothetical protein